MSYRISVVLLVVVLGCVFTPHVWAGIIYQNFEPENINALLTGPAGGRGLVSVIDRTEKVHLGRNALKVQSFDYWSGMWIQVAGDTTGIDFKKTNNDRMTFWIYALPKRSCYVYGCDLGTNNTVGLVFYDNNQYKTTGFEVWTTQTATYDTWTKLKVLFSQIPSDFDLRHVTRVEFKNYLPGVYYFDDLHVVREDRIYQAFEKDQRSGSTDSEYGWRWSDKDTAALSIGGEPVFEGSYSWKLVSTADWGGTGIQSQEKKYYNNNGAAEQTFWRVDLSPEFNDRLTFWVYASPANEMGNNLAVQFYDNTNHSADDTKVVVWTKASATYGEWTRMSVLFSDIKKLAPDFDLNNVNKIQFQHYWPGTFYVDDIRATAAQPVIKETGLSKGTIQWTSVAGATNYRLQESTTGPKGPWRTIYSGAKVVYSSSRLSRSWLRVRWEEGFTDTKTIPYASDWSDVVEARPAVVVFQYKYLRLGQLKWAAVPQTTLYEIQSAASVNGPWSAVYRGGVLANPLSAVSGRWYRIRALKEVSTKVMDLTPWSRPQLYMSTSADAFVRANGMVLRDRKGQGDILTLRGVNLGGYLVIEPWMMGLPTEDPEDHNPDPAQREPLDDWKIREEITQRFGASKAKQLLQTYENAYLNVFDFDYLLDQGITMVRLPFYYRNLQSDNGQWINVKGQIDFTPLDRVVDALSDRGIYVIIDLHGAPGGQSVEVPVGRSGFNKLFDPVEGPAYQQRTQDLWTAVAGHYKANQWVLGYDLLNEPIGIVPSAPPPADLVNLYDRLYQAIRKVDMNHLIIMESVWYPDPSDPENKRYIEDWQTLPIPSQKGWSNVMYQFHFYKWGADSDFQAHKEFIDAKVAEAQIQQPLYNVPLLIGEFTGFEQKQTWEYYLSTFNTLQWNWAMWSYKFFNSPSNWGMANHARYDEAAPPRFHATYSDGTVGDSFNVLTRKLEKYTTADYHSVNQTLQQIVSSGIRSGQFSSVSGPYITGITALFVKPYADNWTIQGQGFGASRGSGNVKYGERALPLISWSDTSIRVYLNDPEAMGAAPITVTTDAGQTSNAVDIIAVNGVDIIGVNQGIQGTMSATSGGGFQFSGNDLGDTPGKVTFYWAPSSVNKGDAAISFWSDTLIKGFVPPDAVEIGSRYNISAQYGGELYPTMMMANRAPVLMPVTTTPLVEGNLRIVTLSATDYDMDKLTYSAEGLPPGASLFGKRFVWTPTEGQAGRYRVTFKVSDGQAMDEQSAILTVHSKRSVLKAD